MIVTNAGIIKAFSLFRLRIQASLQSFTACRAWIRSSRPMCCEAVRNCVGGMWQPTKAQLWYQWCCIFPRPNLRDTCGFRDGFPPHRRGVWSHQMNLESIYIEWFPCCNYWNNHTFLCVWNFLRGGMEEVLHLRAKFNSLRLQSLSLVPLTAKNIHCSISE